MIRTAASLRRVPFALVALAILPACTSSAPGLQTGAALTPAANQPVSQQPYVMSERELKLSCKDLTGAMRVRILQVQSTTQQSGTVAARALQAGATTIWGGPGYGISPEADRERDLAQLEAYNRQLAAMSCKTLDLPAELNGAAANAAPAKSL